MSSTASKMRGSINTQEAKIVRGLKYTMNNAPLGKRIKWAFRLIFGRF